MASYLRPRRGKAATATSQNIVLKRGEVFFETPTGGVGTGIGKIKMGDGSTSYSSLPYFLKQLDLSDNATKCAFTNVTAATASSNNQTYLNNISPSNSLKTLFNNIKQLLLNFNSQLTSLNNDLDISSYSELRTYGLTNLLNVNLTNQNSTLHKLIYFGTEDASKLTNSPVNSGSFYGYRVVRYNSTDSTTTHLVTVEIHEQFPKSGRVWVNTYDIYQSQKWCGWTVLNTGAFVEQIRKVFTKNSVSFGAYGKVEIPLTTPAGYTYGGILGVNATGAVHALYIEYNSSNDTKAVVWNPGSAATLSVDVTVQYFKNSL